ncbi:uncharacterized protein LOC106026489 isoform X4 [Cavia porcellus]|uniref:uncharacterized protein LOC106026489 isoform X4 n=1 Tax=Cavia porcellus TaxID=10141 RepID=UPI002FE0075C
MRMSEPHSVNDFGAISIMLQGHSTVFQALRGTFFTWGMTAAGAALVFVFSSGQRRILDGRLGFAAGFQALPGWQRGGRAWVEEGFSPQVQQEAAHQGRN